jgi:two-component system, chemotaxis family, chemotaxis protein CheY
MSFDVMVVDDSPVMRRFIRRVMDVSGFPVGKCLEAGNGREALQKLEQQWVDAVLTDINMPEMDGESFVREMRARHHMSSVPVIVISTDATDSRMERLRDLGAQGYVTKPFAPERLRSELERVLGFEDGVPARDGAEDGAPGEEDDDNSF